MGSETVGTPTVTIKKNGKVTYVVEMKHFYICKVKIF